MTLISLIAVGGAGFLGAILRFYSAEKLNKQNRIPYGTLVVNLTGSFMLGIITGIYIEGKYLLIVGTGFLGALTTFSTLNVELIKLKDDRSKRQIYFIATYVGGVLVAFIGYLLGSYFSN